VVRIVKKAGFAFLFIWHWLAIRAGMAKGWLMVRKGLPFTSEEFLQMNDHLTGHFKNMLILKDRADKAA
jgi:hypothetical protein